MTNSSYVTTESGGRQNMFPTETRPYIDESVSYEGYPQNAEKVNGRWAMIGFVALLGAYVTTESGGRQNMFPTETRPYIDESVSYEGYPQNAEKVNGRWAMIGFIALLGAYITTGQIIPGFVQTDFNFHSIDQ